MALNVQVGTVTQPGGTGNATISLPSNFDPKAIIMWTNAMTASGTAASWTYGYGFGTYRGSTVVQRMMTSFHTDAAATMNVASRGSSTALCGLLIDGGTGALDMEIDLVSMQTGATSNVVINWTALHTTASILVNYMILGGSDITDALVGQYTMVTGATQDVTVVAGFGQPDLLCFATPNMNNSNTTNQWAGLSVGWGGKNFLNGRMSGYSQVEGNTASVLNYAQNATCACAINTSTAGTYFMRNHLSATAAWPTDGFEVTYDTQANGDFVYYLALKGTFTYTLGATTVPTAVAPQTTNLAHSTTPTGVFLWGGNITTVAGIDTANAELLSWGFGAGDGTNEVYLGVSDDDGLGTSDTNRAYSNSKVWQYRGPAGVTLTSEADHSFSGSNVAVAWNDTDTVAREYNYLLLGSAAGAAAEVIPDLVMARS